MKVVHVCDKCGKQFEGDDSFNICYDHEMMEHTRPQYQDPEVVKYHPTKNSMYPLLIDIVMENEDVVRYAYSRIIKWGNVVVDNSDVDDDPDDDEEDE